MTPNQVTFLSGAIGIAAGVMIGRGGYGDGVMGALLLQLSVVFDDVDGELARLKRQFSAWGEMLDNTMDTVTHLAVFAGIAVAVSRAQGLESVLWPGALLLSGVVITFALVTYLERRVFPGAGDNPVLQRLQSYVELLSGRDSSVIVLLFALAGRFDWFLYGAAVGAHVFWASVLWIYLRAEKKTAGARDDGRGAMG